MKVQTKKFSIHILKYLSRRKKVKLRNNCKAKEIKKIQKNINRRLRRAKISQKLPRIEFRLIINDYYLILFNNSKLSDFSHVLLNPSPKKPIKILILFDLFFPR